MSRTAKIFLGLSLSISVALCLLMYISQSGKKTSGKGSSKADDCQRVLETAQSSLRECQALIEQDNKSPSPAAAPDKVHENSLEAAGKPKGETTASQPAGPVPDVSMLAPLHPSPASQPAYHEAVSDFIFKTLNLSDSETLTLTDEVCALKALRGALFQDYAEGSLESQVLYEDLVTLREEVTIKMRKMLGEERYAKLRDIGGIGALGDVVDCGPTP